MIRFALLSSIAILPVIASAGGTGTVSSLCEGLSVDECIAYVDTQYNSPPPIPEPDPTPDPDPPPPPSPTNHPLTVTNLQAEEVYSPGESVCLSYDYTVPNDVSQGIELRQVFNSDWSQAEVNMDAHTVSFPSSVNERCANITLPDSEGLKYANICLSIGDGTGDNTQCKSIPFAIEGTTSGGGSADITPHWYATLNEGWSGANTFGVGDTVRVLFGAQNNGSATANYDAELKVWKDGVQQDSVLAPISMPGNSNKDQNGEDPRFTTSFDASGSYDIQLCVPTGGCKEVKTITVTGGSSGIDVAIYWWNNFKTSDNSWTTPETFSPNEDYTVMFGGYNNGGDVTFNAELKVWKNGTQQGSHFGSISMPANSSSNTDGVHPRFTTSFSDSGTYTTQLCVASACGSQKTITVQ